VTKNDEISEFHEPWFDGEGRIYIVWGILNPNGPTLYCLGTKKHGRGHRLFYRWLHMLGGETYFCGDFKSEKLSYVDILLAAQQINEHLAAARLKTFFNVIPSFLASHMNDAGLNHIAEALLQKDKARSEDWGRELAYLDQFQSDFFGRAGAELKEHHQTLRTAVMKHDGVRPPIDAEVAKYILARYGQIPAFRDAQVPSWTASEYSDELFGKWLELVKTDAHTRAAFQTLGTMWNGAISLLSEDGQAEAVPFDRVIDFICDYKFFPKIDSAPTRSVS
jgi:hypothetical protein